MSVEVPGIKVWSDLVYDSAIAKTKDTFDKVNSNAAEIKIEKPDAEAILGFLIGYCATKLTDAENLPDLILQLSSKALGISEEEIVIPGGGNDADANTDYTPIVTAFYPFRAPLGKKLFNAALSFKATPSVTSTEGLDVLIATLYSNQEPDAEFALELLAQRPSRVDGGAAKADAAKAHAAAGGSVSLTSLPIPTGVKELRGILTKINPNGITADDPISGFMEFQCTGIPDFSPQRWPLSVFFNPVLGTVAEGIQLGGKGRTFPTRFPMTGAAVTITVQSTLLVAAGTAPDTTQAVAYRNH
ncbi:MAG: hypothetical protein V3V00_16120 [Saprospiraceae bacterium]